MAYQRTPEEDADLQQTQSEVEQEMQAQEPGFKDAQTLERLAPAKYEMKPELADYLSRAKTGVNQAALDERQQNNTWDTFDKLGDIRANTYGLKNVHIANPSDVAQTEAAGINKMVSGAELGDIQGHKKNREELALALARKREVVPRTGESNWQSIGGAVSETGQPLFKKTQDGKLVIVDKDNNPVEKVMTAADHNLMQKQKATIGEDLAEFSNGDEIFKNIDARIQKMTKDSKHPYNKLEDVLIEPGGLYGSQIVGADLPGVSIPGYGQVNLGNAEAAGFQSDIGKLLAAYQKSVSGLTASNPEMKRIVENLQQGKFSSEGERLQGLKDLKSMLMAAKKMSREKYGPEVLSKYDRDREALKQMRVADSPSIPETEPSKLVTLRSKNKGTTYKVTPEKAQQALRDHSDVYELVTGE